MPPVARARSARSQRSKFRLVLGLALFAASAAVAWADAIEHLQGPWVMQSSSCTSVFEKIGGEIRFKDRNYALDSGLIIAGSKAAGPIAGCKISEVDEDGDRFSALLTCSDALMSRTFAVSFRIVDATHIERLDPKRPAAPMRYKKCLF